MDTHSKEEAIQVVLRGLGLLALVTIAEVAVALIGNGHLIDGFTLPKVIMYPVMIGLSIYKAYFIIYEFMHMRYEMPGLRMTVLLPMLLLVWAIVAFFQEGGSWGQRRQLINEKNQIETNAESMKLEGSLYVPGNTDGEVDPRG